MAENFADRLLEAIERAGSPVCVGVDPVLERLPQELRSLAAVEAIERFSLGVVEAVAGIVPAIKPQIACFERYGTEGIGCYHRVVAAAREAGLIVIADVKRGDIGSTAAHYAAAYLGAKGGPDAITVNGYFGADGLAPFIDAARDAGKGIFVLVRTSNPSAKDIQDFADADGKLFFQRMAAAVAEVGKAKGLIGKAGYSCVGAVVGATYPDEARALRGLMPQQLFLVPGYGAQGASADDCAAAFDQTGRGAIVNASRSVIYAFDDKPCAGATWTDAVAAAAKTFAQDIAAAVAK